MCSAILLKNLFAELTNIWIDCFRYIVLKSKSGLIRKMFGDLLNNMLCSSFVKRLCNSQNASLILYYNVHGVAQVEYFCSAQCSTESGIAAIHKCNTQSNTWVVCNSVISGSRQESWYYSLNSVAMIPGYWPSKLANCWHYVLDNFMRIWDLKDNVPSKFKLANVTCMYTWMAYINSQVWNVRNSLVSEIFPFFYVHTSMRKTYMHQVCTRCGSILSLHTCHQ